MLMKLNSLGQKEQLQHILHISGNSTGAKKKNSNSSITFVSVSL